MLGFPSREGQLAGERDVPLGEAHCLTLGLGEVVFD
jgi:hypothetical protein